MIEKIRSEMMRAGIGCTILQGDCREVLAGLPAETVQCCVTSPPYFGLRDYQVAGQIGLESTPADYVAELVEVFRGVKRVLRDDGTVWLNLGDSYAAGLNQTGRNDAGRNLTGGGGNRLGSGNPGNRQFVRFQHGVTHKNLLGIPWRVAFALQADGWFLRSAIIWHKPNPMPESVRDRPTSAYEMVFLFAKNASYFYDADAIAEPSICVGDTPHLRRNVSSESGQRLGQGGARAATAKPVGLTRNARNVWTIAPRPFKGAHFATFPIELAERCIKAGTSERGACGNLIKKLKLRADLTEEQRAKVYARLGSRGIA